MEHKDFEEVWESIFNVLLIGADFEAFYVLRCSWENVSISHLI